MKLDWLAIDSIDLGEIDVILVIHRQRMAAGTAGYCQARGRMKLTTLEKIFRALAETLERRILDGERWLGQRRVKILDGTGLSMPDTRKNQQRWPQSKGQKPGCGFPILRMVGLFCLGEVGTD